MTETADALSFFATDAGALRFFALLFPGIIAVAVFDLRVPGARRKWNDMGLGLLAYSILIDIAAAVWLYAFPITTATSAFAKLATAVAFDLVMPAVIGWFIVDLRDRLADNGLILSSMPKAWDELFRRLRHHDETYAIVLTLADGRKVGGFWAARPFASSYPADEDLLIPVPAIINQNTGAFESVIAGAQALLVKRSDIVTLEVFDAEMMAVVARGAGQQAPQRASATATVIEPSPPALPPAT